MKKFIFYFICYIGLAITLFNPFVAKAEDYSSSTTHTVNINPTPKTEQKEEKTNSPRSIIQSNNELTKLIIIPFIIDKLYPEEEINQDLTGFLHQIYPTTKIERLEKLETFIKFFVSAKRRYDYVVNKLEQKVKALSMLPADAPIIAQDGEFAPENPNQRKQTPYGQYGVNYTAYKYLEYDHGESGEPVRRRDKNYVEEPDISAEITLALLKLDIAGFYRALKKIPANSDGSAEKTITLPNGVQSRLLLDVSEPGNNEKIRGVIDVYVPQNYYINGDYLNPNSRPQFILSEDKTNSHNIKSYQLFHPTPAGINANGQNKRIFTGNIRFPIEFNRIDTSKGLNISGTFSFELCNAQNSCQTITTNHRLRLKPSANHVFSLYNNYVIQGFAHLPQEKSSHAELKETIYSPNTGKLTVRFATSRRFSNVAVMAENKNNINFINPRYAISNDEIVAEFDNATPELHPSTGEVAVTAIFNDFENLRKVVIPQIINDNASSTIHGFSRPKWFSAFMFGLYLNFMPVILYLFVRLLKLFWQKQHRYRIFLRYALGAATGLALICTLYHQHYFAEMYENAFIITAAGFISVSFIMECLGFMDFDLFRPLKRFAHRGFFIGFFSVLLIASFPMYNAPQILSYTLLLPTHKLLLLVSGIWCGLLFLPLLTLLFTRPNYYILAMLRRLSVFYNLIFVIAILALLYMSRGLSATLLTTASFALVAGLWYIYPHAINITTKQTSSINRKKDIFSAVQKHALIAITVIFVLNSTLLTLFKPEKPLLSPTPEQVITMAKNYNSRGVPVLVVITADWSFTSLINRKDISLIKSAGIKVIQIKATGSATNALPWFKTYGVEYPPLNVLFTSRHQQGLVLPKKLRLLNWQTALKEFTTSKKERTSSHD